MGLRQSFRFKHSSIEEVRTFLRGLSHAATLDDRSEFLVFSELPAQSPFSFDCELVEEGFHSERAGDYFAFLGIMVEGLTGHFGSVRYRTHEDLHAVPNAQVLPRARFQPIPQSTGIAS